MQVFEHSISQKYNSLRVIISETQPTGAKKEKKKCQKKKHNPPVYYTFIHVFPAVVYPLPQMQNVPIS